LPKSIFSPPEVGRGGKTIQKLGAHVPLFTLLSMPIAVVAMNRPFTYLSKKSLSLRADACRAFTPAIYDYCN